MKNVVTVVGIQTVSYKNKDGRQVDGFRLHMTLPGNQYTNGMMVDNVYVSAQQYAENKPLKPGDKIRIFYNRYGNVDGWELA